MKTRQLSILTLLLISTWFLSDTFAEDTTQWGLPEGAIARIGKGQVSGNIAFSPDNNLLAVASTIGIWMYDVHSGEQINLLTGHTGFVRYIAFSPDGSLLASGSNDHTVRLWDVATGRHKMTLTGHTSLISGVAFSPDGSTLASSSKYRDNRLNLWDVTTGELKGAPIKYAETVDCVAFSPNGDVIASVSSGIVHLWDPVSRELKATFTRDIEDEHTDHIYSIAFNPDGSTLATAYWNDTVSLWNVATGEHTTLTGHTADVRSVAFNPKGKMLASGSEDGTVCLWDAISGTYITTLTEHTRGVTSVAFSPNGYMLASASWDGTVRLWDAVSYHPMAKLTGHISNTDAVAFSPDGQTLASVGGGSKNVYLWDVVSRKSKAVLIGHANRIASIAFSPDGKTLASGGGFDNPTIQIWDIGTGKRTATFTGHTETVNSIAFSPDGRLLASASADERVCLWDVDRGYHHATFIGHTAASVTLAFSPDGKTLASGGNRNDPKVHLWNVSSKQNKATLQGSTNTLAFSPDGQLLASGWVDISLWDPESGTLKGTLEGHTQEVRSVAFSPNGRILASGGWDKTIRLWDITEGTHITTLTGHNSTVRSLAFSPDGRVLASASWDSTILLWQMPSAPSTVVLETTDFEAEKAAIQEVYSRFYKAFNERDFEKVAETMDTSRAAMFGTVFSDSEPIPVVIGWNSVRVLIEGLWRGIGTKGAKWGPNDKLADFWMRQTEASARGYNCYKGPYPGETYLYLVKKNGEWRIQQIESITQDNLPIFKDNPRIRNYFTDPENKTQNMDEPAISQRREDLNSDGVVNIQDLVIVSANFGKRGQTVADVNGDDIVDIRDLVLVAGAINHEQ